MRTRVIRRKRFNYGKAAFMVFSMAADGNHVVRRRRTVRDILILEEELGRSSLASNSRALSGGSTRTCDQSDLCKRHIHF